MIVRTLDEVATATRGHVRGAAALTIDSVTTDSRTVPGGRPVFIALSGEHGDGHDHVPDAVAAGAVAILSERELPDAGVPVVEVTSTWAALADLARDVRRVVDPTAVAITGSVGKTTVKDLTAAAVGAARDVHASRGSFNNELGVPLTLLGLEAGTDVLVAEVGARHLGDIAVLAPLIAPDVAVVTSVAGVHLEVFGTIETVATAKAELVDALAEDGTAVLNLDDPRVAAMADRANHVIGVGLAAPSGRACGNAGASVFARDVVLDGQGRPRAIAVTPWGETRVSVPVAGRHQLTNALLALAVAGHLGVDLDQASAAIGTAVVSHRRGEVLTIGGVTVLDDAYNANPTSVTAALDTVSSMVCSGRRWTVLGVMAEIGPTASAEHEAVGRRWARSAIDQLIAVGPEAAAIVEGALAAGALPENVHRAANVTQVVERLLSELQPGDVVLVKGSRVAGLEVVVDALRRADVDALRRANGDARGATT